MLNCPKCGATLKLHMELVPAAEAEAAPSAASRPVEARQPSPKPAQATKPAEPGSVGALLMRIDENVLEGKERDFVRETRERFKKYGANTRMSEKQLAWLGKLAGKAVA